MPKTTTPGSTASGSSKWVWQVGSAPYEAHLTCLLLQTFSLWGDELGYVDSLIQDDLRNNSAWNQRYFVVSNTTGFSDDVIRKEVQ